MNVVVPSYASCSRLFFARCPNVYKPHHLAQTTHHLLRPHHSTTQMGLPFVKLHTSRMASSVAFIDDCFVNTRGHTIQTQHVLPPNPPRAVAVVAHGYAHYGRGLAQKLTSLPAQHGIALYSLDHVGHGQSHGLKGWVERFDHLIEDFGQYVRAVSAKHPGVPIFIIGESMGGAITLMSTLEGGSLHGFVSGLILLAPMCKIADNLKPPEWQITVLSALAYLAPTLPIAPIPDVIALVYKDQSKIEEARNDPLSYRGRARIGTALELYNATLSIAERIPTVSVPFIVLHGGADRVTDPTISKDLYERAISTDKTFKLYDGMWHSMLDEPEGGADLVLGDVAEWLNARIPAAALPTS